MKKAPIIENLLKYIETNPFSGHTPGHKNGRIVPPLLKEKWSQEIWQYDITEIINMDNLHNPTGCIKEAQEQTAQLYKAKASYFLVNGTSVGIQAAILALAYESPIFVPRNVHKSVYDGLILANAEPIYLPVVYDENLPFPLGIEPEVLADFVKKYPKCKTLIITHPTYQGISYKIKEIMSIALANNLKVIVDEAHGSHLAFHDKLAPSALSLGAQIAVQSWHKTLPVLTQASVLHVGANYSGRELQVYLNLLQTTSPSYLLLASLDSCRAFLAQSGSSLIEKQIGQIECFQKKIGRLNNIKGTIENNKAILDPFKVCLTSRKTSGYNLADLLRKKYNIYVELAEEEYCLILLGIINDQSFLDNLFIALADIDSSLDSLPPYFLAKEKAQVLVPQTKVLIRKAFFQEKEKINLDRALGRVAGDFFIKYPPGIPLLVPGEVIDKKSIEILQKDPIQYKVEDGITVIREGEEHS